MIHESYVWKKELAKEIRNLRRRLKTVAHLSLEQGSDRASIAVEKFAFIFAFIVRKLADSKKLSDELEGTSVPVKTYLKLSSSRKLRHLDHFNIDEFYDLENS